MKNTIKIFKNPTVTFILGAIIFSCIGAVVVSISSDSITYTTNKNNNVATLKDALDDLYEKSSSSSNEIFTPLVDSLSNNTNVLYSS